MQLLLAGGQATRMGGGNKALLSLNGIPLIERVLARLTHDQRLISARAEHAQALSAYGEIVLDEPQFAGLGPLAGIHAGATVAHALGAQTLLVVPCDAPFLPLHLSHALHSALQHSPLAYAQTPAGIEAACCYLKLTALPLLEARLCARELRLQDAWQALGGQAVWFDDARAFANINSADDLAGYAS